MDEHEENFKDIFRYTDVEYTPDGYTDVYRWDDFLVIAGDQVEDRLRHEISCNCMQSTVDAFKLLSDKIGFEFEPENNPANVAKAASAAAGRSVDSGLSEAGGIKH